MSNQELLEQQSQSPMVHIDLSQINTDPDVLSVSEEAYLGHINLRGASDNTSFMSAAQGVLGITLPTEFNTFVRTEKLTALWYGPNEWLVVTERGEQSTLIAELRQALDGVFSAVTDISGGNTVLNISGSRARDLLAKGCPMDLHPSVFAVGQCAQTVLAKAGMCVYKYAEADQFKIIIRRSFSDYLGAWMIDAAREYANHSGE